MADASRKRELKREYLETSIPAGVFQIRNTANGKVFVAAGVNLNGKMNSHRAQLEFGSHRNTALQDDWNTFGPDSFEFAILDFMEPDNDPARNIADDVAVLEAMWLDKIEPYGDKGYNIQRVK